MGDHPEGAESLAEVSEVDEQCCREVTRGWNSAVSQFQGSDESLIGGASWVWVEDFVVHHYLGPAGGISNLV